MSDYYLCESCGHREDLEGRMRVYEEGYSGEVRPTVRIGWCRGCSKVVQIEYVPSMKEFEEELAIIEKKALLPFHSPEWLKLHAKLRFAPWGPEWARVAIAEYMRWRNMRKNPSRCFECGSFEVSLADNPFGPIPCPQCTGTMTAKLTLVVGSDRVDPDVYSFEGDLLRKGKGVIEWRTRWVLPPGL